ncbi:MAG: PINc/VapC family ATPase [Halococcoides sp.]
MEIVPDTSVIVDGQVTTAIADDRFVGADVLIHEAVLGELEAQANDGRRTGVDGLDELQSLRRLAEAGDIGLEFAGKRASPAERANAKAGAIDAAIRDLAADRSGTLVTADQVQRDVAQARGIAVEFLDPDPRGHDELAIEQFFDDQTMSVHLRVGAQPRAKRGSVGEMAYEPIAEQASTDEEVQRYAREIETAAAARADGFVEIDEPGMTIVQLGTDRIAIARPPFADGMEITAVRPIVETSLEDYAHADDLRERLQDGQRGVLIAGAPGAGKSTFAQAVATMLADAGHAVKTMEKPRDLQVDERISQYTALAGSMETTADALLMVRPDYTIYDEVRTTDDVEVFADMRLAGVGMIGVVHATRGVDALQRLIGRVELGLIPQVVDTVIYVEAGEIAQVYDVSTDVKVPKGLMEADLARPVVMVEDFETGEPAFEIYSFNRQVVTVPLDGAADESGVEGIAREQLTGEIRSIANGRVEVELQGPNSAVVYVEDRDISQVIGKNGDRISAVEDRLGLEIDVRTFEDREDVPAADARPAATGDTPTAGRIVAPDITSRHVIVPADDFAGETVEVRAGDEYLFTATVSRGGEIQVSRGSAIAEELERAIDRGRQVTIVPS